MLPVRFGKDVKDHGIYTDALLLAEGDRDDLVICFESDDRGVIDFPSLISHCLPPSRWWLIWGRAF